MGKIKHIPDKGKVIDLINRLETTRDREPGIKEEDLKVHLSRNVPPEKEGGEWTRDVATYTLEELIALRDKK